jgi:hypothetical protein
VYDVDDVALTTQHEVIMYSIYDTREPEGNGGPVVIEPGEPLTFETHDEAVSYVVEHFGDDALRMVIAGSPEDESPALWYCDMDLPRGQGVCNTPKAPKTPCVPTHHVTPRKGQPRDLGHVEPDKIRRYGPCDHAGGLV